MKYPIVLIDLKGGKHFITIKYIVDIVQYKKFTRVYTVANVVDTESPAKELLDIIAHAQKY